MTHIIVGDAREALKRLPPESVHCIVTSPPYFGLRDYGVAGQIGLEPSPEEFVAELVGVFREARRVLRDDGTLWLNMGDSYCSIGGQRGYGSFDDGAGRGPPPKRRPGNPDKNKGNSNRNGVTAPGYKNKDLIGIPWMLAFALRADGWYLRSDIIWHKPNPMPESVRDRCTKAHEYVFLLSKSEKYFYDNEAVLEPTVSLDPTHTSYRPNSARIAVEGRKEYSAKHGMSARNYNPTGRNRRSVWTITTKPFKGAHFAAFPPDLIEPCILAGCPEGGIVLDPFFGAGTTGVVAKAKGRQCIGVELNPAYAEMARQRIGNATLWPLDPPMLEAAN